MKNMARLGILLALAAVIALAGCASSDDEPKSNVEERRDLPQFFLTPPTPEDQYVGLGMAKLEDDSLSRSTALTRARRDIANQVSVRVASMLTDYAQESGADGNSQTLTFVESVTKEVSQLELKGAITKEQYPASDGTWYAMVYFPKAALLETVGEVFNRNEDAAFAEFKAQQALARLESYLEDQPLQSAGMDSPVNQP